GPQDPDPHDEEIPAGRALPTARNRAASQCRLTSPGVITTPDPRSGQAPSAEITPSGLPCSSHALVSAPSPHTPSSRRPNNSNRRTARSIPSVTSSALAPI